MRLNTFRKYFFALSGIFLLCLSFITIILSFLINDTMADEKYKTLIASCNSLKKYASTDYLSSGFRRNVYNINRTITDTTGNYLLIVDKQGTVISCSCDDYALNGSCIHSTQPIDSSVLSQIREKTLKKADHFSQEDKEIYYQVAVPVTSFDNTVVGYIFAIAPMGDQSAFHAKLFKLFAFSAVVPILILFFALYAMTYRWTKPLKLISEATVAMSNGDFSKRIPIMSNDEIGMLSQSFNSMTNSLVELENMRRNFIANVSHELKTPMTTIGGFIDGILDGTIEPEKQTYYLELVSKEVKRLSRLVQGMLSLSKLEAGEVTLKPSSFDFRELLLDVVFSQEQRIESRKLEVTGLDALPSCTITADRDLIHQVVYNLCDNAVKFTNEGGEIRFAAKPASDSLAFSIRNTGSGIPEKDLPFIFDRFYKGDKSRSAVKDSTGLGLYLVKEIVKLHGGEIVVSSKENEFCEFCVTLPLTPPAQLTAVNDLRNFKKE